MENRMTKTVLVQAKTLKIDIIVRNKFYATLTDQDDISLGSYEGYVPHFIPNGGDDDYLRLNIDINTGQITNWKTPSREDIEKFIVRAQASID